MKVQEFLMKFPDMQMKFALLHVIWISASKAAFIYCRKFAVEKIKFHEAWIEVF
jgi:hypothetical protein